jgi:D-alanine-D-alanine ligase
MPRKQRRGAQGTVAVLHGAVPPDAPKDDQDTLVQVAEVAGALQRLGWRVEPVPVTLNLDAFARRLAELKPALAFNLIEALDGMGQFIHLAPTLLDRLGLPYTGCDSTAIMMTSHKILAKRAMVSAGIATPNWIDDQAGGGPVDPADRFIVKSVWEDASIGLDAGSVVKGVVAARRRIAEMAARHGGTWFAESYIDGREFNVAILDSGEGPEVLPVGEIRFIDYPADRPRILDYASKWDRQSFAYNNTPHVMDLDPADAPLIDQMRTMAQACWRLFQLQGYARVDFRVDALGRPYVLEVNANPCLSPDAGYPAMLERAGIGFDQAIERIVAPCLAPAAVRRHAI